MARARKLLPPDPRPSRAHPEHRATRKQLEKEHGYGWVPPVILGLVGLTLAFDVTKDVEKAEERHKKRDEEQQEGEGDEEQERKRRMRGEARGRSSRRRHRGNYEDDDGGGGGGDGYEYVNGDGDGWHGGKRDELLARGDRLEKGEGGPWDRERERERRKRSEYNDVAVDDYYAEDEGRYPRRGRDDLDYERGRRALDDRRSRPRPRRRSSDW